MSFSPTCLLTIIGSMPIDAPVDVAPPLPIKDPVIKITLLLGAVLLAPLVAKRLRLPGIIGLILAGILLGPHSFGILERGAIIELFSMMGLLYIMFVAGAEIDLHEFGRSRQQTIFFGAATFLIPLVMGTLAGVYWLDFSWTTSILLATMFSSHTLVAYPIISGPSLARKEVSVVGLGGTIITDTAALLVLAIIAAMEVGEIGALFWVKLAVAMAVVAPGILVAVPRLGRWAFRRIGSEGGIQFLFVVVVFFGCGWLAHAVGLEPIIGAFFAGLALNRMIPEHSTLMNRLQFFGNYFFIPLFLIAVGMLVDVRTMVADARAWNVSLTMIVIALLSKLAAAKFTQWRYGYSRDEGYVLYSLSVAQAAATMAAVLVGFRLGIFDDSVVNGTVLMILVTCLVAPWVADRFGRKLAIEEARQTGALSRQIQERILVPVVHRESADWLLDFSFLLHKAEKAPGPVHVLRVGLEGPDERAEVARAEQLLGDCVARGAAAEVPVNPVVHLDINEADGILRAAREVRATTVVIGWKRRPTAHDRLFGSTFDQIVEKLPQRLIACRLNEAISTIKRMVLALPPLAEFDRQFDANIRLVKYLSREYGVPLHVLLSDDSEARQRIEDAAPQMDTTFEPISQWDHGRACLQMPLLRDDLFVLFGARPGALQWRPWLYHVPNWIAEKYPDTPMFVLHPAKAEFRAEGDGETAPSPDEEPQADLLMASIPYPGGIVFVPEGMAFDEAVRVLLDSAIAPGEAAVDPIQRSLQEVSRQYTPEIAPGVALLHTHNVPLPQSRVIVGISRVGIAMPGASRPIGVVFIILGAQSQSTTAHVHLLAAIAQRVRTPQWIEALRAAATPEEARRMITIEDERPRDD